MRWWILCLTVACSGGRDVPAADAFSSGTWRYMFPEEGENTCDVDYGIQVTDFFLTNNGDGTITHDPNDGTPPIVCTLDGVDFTCPARYVEDVLVEVGAVTSVWVTTTGTFDSPQQGSGRQVAELTCVDTSCEQVAAVTNTPNPCIVETTFDLSWAGGAR